MPSVCVATALAKGLELQKTARTRREPHASTHEASAPSDSSCGNQGEPEGLPLTPASGQDLTVVQQEPVLLGLSASRFLRLYLFIAEKINYLIFSVNRLKAKTSV